MLTFGEKSLLGQMTLCTKIDLLPSISTISVAMLGASCCCDGSYAPVPGVLAKLQVEKQISRHRLASQPHMTFMHGVDAHCDLLCAGTERQGGC